MKKSEALLRLTSPKTHDRMQAARFFAEQAEIKDRETIAVAFRKERVRWVKTALEMALQKASGQGPLVKSPTDKGLDENDSDETAYDRGVADTTRRFLHEISPLSGLIEVSAKKEITNYSTSAIRIQIERLSGLLEAMNALSQASETAALETLDLAGCIRDIVDAAKSELGCQIQTHGPTPLIVRGNRGLIDLITMNALRNAFEAEATAGVASEVVVSWGETDRDIWLSVLDRGIGLPLHYSKAFEIGSSTKGDGHFGMGLAIAQRAARSMHGSIALRPRQDGGTAFEFRWPIAEEYSQQ